MFARLMRGNETSTAYILLKQWMAKPTAEVRNRKYTWDYDRRPPLKDKSCRTFSLRPWRYSDSAVKSLQIYRLQGLYTVFYIHILIWIAAAWLLESHCGSIGPAFGFFGVYSRLYWERMRINVLIPGLRFIAFWLWGLPRREYRLQSDWWGHFCIYTLAQRMQCMRPVAFVKSSRRQGRAPASHAPRAFGRRDDDTLSIIACKPYPSQRYIQCFTAAAVSALPAPLLLMHNHWAFVWKSLRQNKWDGLLLLLPRICYTGQGRREAQCMDGKLLEEMYTHSTKWKVCI